jgi:hypothetical protein
LLSAGCEWVSLGRRPPAAARIDWQMTMRTEGRRRYAVREPSPDDTSLLGLAAVWAELDAPMPAKRRASHRDGRRSRSLAPTMPVALIAGLAAAVLLVVAMFVMLLNLIR